MLRKLRSKIDGFLIEGAFHSLARLGQLHPRAKPESHGVEVLRDIPYRDTSLAEHRLDVYRPIERKGLLPVVLYVHGGGFCILSKDTHWIMGLAFARRGYVVFNINYRLAPANKYPGAIEDVSRAWTWLAKNAELYGGDPSRIVVAGESAGANLVTALSVATSYEREEPWARAAFEAGQPRVVVAHCGLHQVSDTKRFARREKYPDWLARAIERCERAYVGGVEQRGERFFDLADPVVALERGEPPARPLPSYLVACGTKDPLLDDSRRLASAVERLSGPAKLLVYPGEVHAFHAFIWRQSARDYWNACHDFVRAELAGTQVTRKIGLLATP
jgi:acetyl esterase